MSIHLCYNCPLEEFIFCEGDEMSQYYPQQGPVYPPEQGREDDYYYEEGDYEYEELEGDDRSNGSLMQTLLAFFAGGCLVFLCMSFCGVLLAGLWILDPGSSLSSTPIPGSDIGLSFDEPAFPDESVVNEQKMQLTILDVNRNAALDTAQPVESRETIIVTIELVNLGDEEEASFNERDFVLVNAFEEAYEPAIGSVTGALGRGSLPPGEGLEGRLVFEVIEGEIDLLLVWDPGRDNEPRYIFLE